MSPLSNLFEGTPKTDSAAMSRIQSTLLYVSWVAIGTYLLVRGLYVMALVPLAGGLANPLARDLKWLYLLEILCVISLFWRPWIAAVMATSYFILMSIVWTHFNSTGVGQFFYDRSLDLCFVGAIYTITAIRSTQAASIKIESHDSSVTHG